jgi:hypothetical protein
VRAQVSVIYRQVLVVHTFAGRWQMVVAYTSPIRVSHTIYVSAYYDVGIRIFLLGGGRGAE